MEHLEFDRLPLIDVTLRLTFDQPLASYGMPVVPALQREFASAYTDAAFGTAVHQPPGRTVRLELMRPPLVFRGHKLGLTASVQHDMLAVTWSAATADEKGYPRFGELLTEAVLCVGRLAAALTAESVTLSVANLAYTNLVVTDGSTAKAILTRFFADLLRPPVVAVDDTFHELRVGWAHDEIDYSARIQLGEATTLDEVKHPAYAVSTAAGRSFAPTLEVTPHLIELHDALLKLFRSILSDEAKHEWGLRE